MNYWTPTTLSQYLKGQGRTLSTRYIRRLCQQGRIRANRLGHEWVIDDDEARRWLRDWLKEAAGESEDA